MTRTQRVGRALPIAGARPVTTTVLLPEDPPVPLPRQLQAYVRGLAPRRLPPAFLVFGQGRAGGTLLGSLLAGHPSVAFADEVLTGRVRAPLRYLNGLRAEHAPRVFGCHVKPHHLGAFQGVADSRGWLERAHREGWVLVHVRREDLLRHVLTGFSSTVRIDPASLLGWLEVRERTGQQELEALDGLPRVTVTYEQDLLPGPEAWSRTSAQVLAALGLEPGPEPPPLQRHERRPLQELAANYDEVVAAVRDTRWARHLD
jgi:hypothetical protein